MRRSDGAVASVRTAGTPRHSLPRALSATDPSRSRERRVLACGAVAVCAVAALVALADPLPAWCVVIAIAIRLAGGAQYAVAVARRRACPNIVTWFLWGLTPMIAAVAQLGDGPGPEVAVTVVLGLGPLVVSAVALRTDRSASRLTPFTAGCASASVLGVVLWQVTAEPGVAIAFAILADLLATLPTLQKAYRAPGSECAPPYLWSVLAMVVTLGTVTGDGFGAYGFALYMLLVNVVLFAFATLPLARILSATARHRLPRGYRPVPVPVLR